ncbi:MAG: hypothetical protein J6039_06310 [Alphaproteobacteria bacterium]|nr:hypothetical protein [Alphaproteobacteria bacterium]
MQKFAGIKYILSTIKSSFLPAMFLLFGLALFYAQNPFSELTENVLHYCFFGVSAVCLVVLGIFNLSKPFFSLLVIVASYICVNRIKQAAGEDFFATPEFLSLSMAVPLNLCFLYFLPQMKLRTNASFHVLLFLLAEAVVWEYAASFLAQIPFVNITFQALSGWAFLITIAVLAAMAVDMSLKNTVANIGLFYATTAYLMSMIYANNASGLTIFYLSAALIMFLCSVWDIYWNYRFDYLENVGSCRSYLKQATVKFPFKYTIVLFGIDNSDKLLKAIGRAKMKTLEQMLINRIYAMPYDLSIFRYNETELLMVFKNEDAKHSKEFAENIRHNIASSEFVFSNNKSVKITISGCVSEKTRKDLNASEVTDRAHSALQKNNRFHGNIIMVA